MKCRTYFARAIFVVSAISLVQMDNAVQGQDSVSAPAFSNRYSTPQQPVYRTEFDFSERMPLGDAEAEAEAEAGLGISTPMGISVNADYTARAAIVGDSTRLADFAAGNFLTSAIPAEGQPFYRSDARANVQGDGSAFALSADVADEAGNEGSVKAEVILRQFSAGTGEAGDSDIAIRQVFGTLNRLTVGVKDSAFADQSAVPEVLDLAGPNARVTVFDAGTGEGQGVLSYEFLSDDPEGFEIFGSIEQGIPEIIAPDDEQAFAHYPDLVLATQYLEGDYLDFPEDGPGLAFYERWHLQWASVVRDLASELPTGVDQNEFGWGTAFSGAFKIRVNNQMREPDRIMFSATYGEGISHYIVDLNAADDTGDAVVNSAGTLEALPVFAAYVGYTHQWSNLLRSTLTLSHVDLDSTTAFGVTESPYRSGDFLAINLLYHSVLSNDTDEQPGKRFYTGIEFLYGEKETLDGANGDAQRILFLVALRS